MLELLSESITVYADIYEQIHIHTYIYIYLLVNRVHVLSKIIMLGGIADS